MLYNYYNYYNICMFTDRRPEFRTSKNTGQDSKRRPDCLIAGTRNTGRNRRCFIYCRRKSKVAASDR